MSENILDKLSQLDRIEFNQARIKTDIVCFTCLIIALIFGVAGVNWITRWTIIPLPIFLSSGLWGIMFSFIFMLLCILISKKDSLRLFNKFFSVEIKPKDKKK